MICCVYYSLTMPTDVGLISFFHQTCICIGCYQDFHLGKYDKKCFWNTLDTLLLMLSINSEWIHSCNNTGYICSCQSEHPILWFPLPTETHLLDSLLVVRCLAFQLLGGLPRISEFRLVEITSPTRSREVLFKLPDCHLHLLQLGMVLLPQRTGSQEGGVKQWCSQTEILLKFDFQFSIQFYIPVPFSVLKMKGPWDPIWIHLYYSFVYQVSQESQWDNYHKRIVRPNHVLVPTGKVSPVNRMFKNVNFGTLPAPWSPGACCFAPGYHAEAAMLCHLPEKPQHALAPNSASSSVGKTDFFFLNCVS